MLSSFGGGFFGFIQSQPFSTLECLRLLLADAMNTVFFILKLGLLPAPARAGYSPTDARAFRGTKWFLATKRTRRSSGELVRVEK